MKAKHHGKVDWHEQWALYAENFYKGKAHIPVGEKTLLLLPGPGFGDLSHPTTRLMMRIMRQYVPKEPVLDLGTGSGILALAALLLDAKSSIGIDIDSAALKHAQKNNRLNRLNGYFTKNLPPETPLSIVLMNMILSEQKQAFSPKFNKIAKLWITSGILFSQKNSYLAQAAEWGWDLISEHQDGEWLGFVFRPQENSADEIAASKELQNIKTNNKYQK